VVVIEKTKPIREAIRLMRHNHVGDVMSYQLVTVNKETNMLDAVKLMRVKGVRRLLVVNEPGELPGILSVDDLLELVAEQLTDIVSLISNEITHEIKSRK
jgi:predicted transcriptional regulator